EGVEFILNQVCEVAAGRPIAVWQTGGEFVDPGVALDIPLLVAAANWHALATWVGRLVPTGPAIMIDIGSSTTDIIPLLDGRPVPNGLTDVERLLSGELLYTGARRTPVFAFAHSVPLRDGHCPMAAELFATTLDVHLILGLVNEDETNTDTANGRPATKNCAFDRLARMLCCDRNELTRDEVVDMAEFLHDVQKQRIRGCVDKVRLRLPSFDQPPAVLISGSGSFLAERVINKHQLLREAEITRLNSFFDAATAEAACAMAVAKLASERSPF
ncbi:MAG: hydantoinase/oxoprolinase family protein, partial [Planctomycetaceae bacterium]